MAGNAADVASFLRGKGLSDTAISGVLGNLQVESGVTTTATNPAEGAIGLAQWENGRRSNLQAYAAAHGGKETDLAMQLGYMWSELTGPYSGALSSLKAATTPAQAATVWDAQYEQSAGTTRSTRIADAQQYASAMPGQGVSWTDQIMSGLALLTPGGALNTNAAANVGVGAVQDGNAIASGIAGLGSGIGDTVTKAGVYLLAFGLAGVVIVLGLSKTTGTHAVPIPV